MPFVLDASVSLSWCFEDETTAQSESVLDLLADDAAVVPTLWELEIANALLVGQRRGRLTEFQAARFVSLLGKLPITIDLMTSDISALLAAGRRHDLSAYDAAYLLLAEREGLALATLDDRLQLAARSAGVTIVTDDN